jgi:hypothetical protein
VPWRSSWNRTRQGAPGDDCRHGCDGCLYAPLSHITPPGTTGGPRRALRTQDIIGVEGVMSHCRRLVIVYITSQKTNVASVPHASAPNVPDLSGHRQGFWSKTHGCVVQGVLQDLATPLELRQRFVHDLHTAHPTDIMGIVVFTKPPRSLPGITPCKSSERSVRLRRLLRAYPTRPACRDVI